MQLIHCREHDKNPEAFFTILYALHDDGLNFRLSVLGQTFTDVPSMLLIFTDILSILIFSRKLLSLIWKETY